MKPIRLLAAVTAVGVAGAMLALAAPEPPKQKWILIDDVDDWTAEMYCGNNDVRFFQQGPGNEGASDGVIDFDSKGNGYVACGTFIQRIAASDRSARVLAGSPGVKGNTDGPPWQATFGNVIDLVVADDITIYAVDAGNLTLRRLTLADDGTWHTETLAGKPGEQGHADGVGDEVRYSAPFDAVTVSGGVVYTMDGDWLRKFDGDRVTTLNAGTGYVNGPLAEAKFQRLMGATSSLAADGQGNLYVGDRWNMAVRKVDLNAGVVSTIAGVRPGEQKDRPTDGPRFEARFHPGGGPMGTFFHRPTGRVIVRSADEGGRIRMIDATTMKTFGPKAGSERGRPLVGPWKDVAGGNPAGVDRAGNVYVRGHGCIRVIRWKGGQGK